MNIEKTIQSSGCHAWRDVSETKQVNMYLNMFSGKWRIYVLHLEGTDEFGKNIYRHTFTRDGLDMKTAFELFETLSDAEMEFTL